MNRILLVVIAILMLAAVGILSCNPGVSNQRMPPPPQQEIKTTEPPPTPPKSLESLNPPPGIDPITGRPKVTPNPPESTKVTTEPQKPEEYGARPERADFETWRAKDFPCIATLPVGTEGKIQVNYDYLVERPLGNRYIVNIKITNLSNRPLKELYYNEFLKDSGGILNKVINEGHHNAPPRFPLQPGTSVILETGRIKLGESFGTTPIESWKLELEVTYLKFE